MAVTWRLLEPLVMAFGQWGQRWVDAELSLQKSVRTAVAADRVKLAGDKRLARHIQKWLGLSPIADGKKLAS